MKIKPIGMGKYTDPIVRAGTVIHNNRTQSGMKNFWGKLAGTVFFLIIFAGIAKSQGPECFFFHFDKSFYASGETIWFKAYQLDPANEARSRVLHVDLVSHQNELISEQKLLIDNGNSYGSITLPVESEEGYYRFRAYTHYNLNFNPAIIYQAEIPIYKVEIEDFVDSAQSAGSNTYTSDARGITIVTEKNTYEPRDSLTISFQVNGAADKSKEGNFSLSIIHSEIAPQRFAPFHLLSCPDIRPGAGRLILPERSLSIEGNLLDPGTSEKINSQLISIYLDKTSQLIGASSREGRMKVSVPDYWGSGVFQVLNLDPYSPSVLELIVESPNSIESPYFNSNQPQRSSRVMKYLNQLGKRRKIIELFDLYESRKMIEPSTSTMIPDAVYHTKDYNQIYSFEEFINEAIGNVRVRTVDNLKTVRLFNKETGSQFTDHPWYIVDGFLTFDEKEVLKIPYQDILEVRLYTKSESLMEYFQGFMLRSGVMEIITRDVKYLRELKNKPNIVEIEGFTLSQNFHSSLGLKNERTIPDLRGVMYWSPNVLTNVQGQGEIIIPLSDDTGPFSIIMMGTNNLFQPVTGYCSFEIKLK